MPLGMCDAGFYVPADKRARFAAGYHQANGELVAEPTANGIPTDYDVQPTAPSGGGGGNAVRNALTLKRIIEA